MRPETLVYETLASVLSGYTGFSAGVSETATNMTVTVRNVPMYRNGRGNVYFTLPKRAITVNSVVRVTNPYDSRQVRILTDGKAFPHPHIWDNGVPCWGGASIRDLTSLFEMMVNTLTWANVTEDSKNIGHFTVCECVTLMGSDYDNQIRSHKRMMADAIGNRKEKPGQYFVRIFPRKLDEKLRSVR